MENEVMSHRMILVHSRMQDPLAMSRIQVNFLNEIPDCSTVWTTVIIVWFH